MGFLSKILRKLCFGSRKVDDGEERRFNQEDDHQQQRQEQLQYSNPTKAVRFGASVDSTLTSRNMETMYDIEEDLTLVAERITRSAALTVDIMDYLLDMLGDSPESANFEYGNKPVTCAELE